MLLNFKSENYTGITSIIPYGCNFSESKPSFILNKLLEDYKSCSEIPPEKRPDSLFSASSPDYTTEIPFSKLLSNHISDTLSSHLLSPPSTLIAIDIQYDISPTSEKILNLLSNLSHYKNYEIVGLITAHGCFHSAYLKTSEQWKSFNDSKMYSWTNLVWNFCANLNYPVMIVLASGGRKGSPCFLSKIDLDAMQRFCKQQDARVKVQIVEEQVSSVKMEKSEDLYKEYTLNYVKRTQEFANKSKGEKRGEGLGKEVDGKREDSQEYIKTVQEYKVMKKNKSEDLEGVRKRTGFSDPYLSKTQNKSVKAGLLYRPGKNESLDAIGKYPKAAVFENPSISTQYSKYLSHPASLSSPKAETLSNTFREVIEDENTEKPNSILKNGWMSARRVQSSEKKVNFSDSVFEIDDSVKGQMAEIKFSRKSPLKFTPSEFIQERSEKNNPNTIKKQDFKTQPVLIRQSEEKIERGYGKADQKFEENYDVKDSWVCVKCSRPVANSIYECGTCRFINWDRFYALKSKGSKVRSESIPARSVESDNFRKSYEKVKEVWTVSSDVKGREKQVPTNYGRTTSKDFRYNS